MKKPVSLLLAFVMVIVAISIAGCVSKYEPVVTTPLLRIGILSDTHINADTRHSLYDRLEKELMFFQRQAGDSAVY